MFDTNGRLMSYHPAMHDEALNGDSFAKRGSPSRSRIPSSFSTNVFCHTCQTNQTLIMNLLSNYLPPSSDPSYSKRLAEFPSYKESLYARYPPVCARCQPSVDEQIQQKDTMARSAALGGWLKASTRRSHSPSAGPGVVGETISKTTTRHGALWNIRGALWLGTAVWWIYSGVAGSLRYPLSPPLTPYPNILVTLVSILWQFWDPTWKTLQRTRLQGHEARAEGKTIWLRCQGLIWIVRVVLAASIALQLGYLSRGAFAAAALLEILTNFIALRNIRIVRPPRIRLVASSRPTQHTPEPGVAPHTTTHHPPPVPPPEVPALSALSLSSPQKPRSSRTVNPIFGVPSLAQSQPQSQAGYNGSDMSDAMDWTPATGPTQEAVELLRPARFAPEKPTGLEGLIEKFGIGGEEPEGSVTNNAGSGDSGVGRGMLVGVLAGLGLVAVTALVVVWFPQWLAGQERTAQFLAPQHITYDL